MKICTVLGARPQFVKAAAVSAEIAGRQGVEEVIIHTGQHYDPEMSAIFFSELNIPGEKYNLKIGSGSHGRQTGLMLEAVEEKLLAEHPDVVLIYGDTNSTLAAALAAVKLHIPVAHVEAGMRSFNRLMPEEINRVVSDHVCDINFCSCAAAVTNLQAEGRGHTAVLAGDVMCDCVRMFLELAARRYDPVAKLGLERQGYLLFTCHRPENTDHPERLRSIVGSVNALAAERPVVYPAHPRTLKYLEDYKLELAPNVLKVAPLGYFESILLVKHAFCLVTDSGGMQKEAFFCGTPCVTARDETEWMETVDAGWNVLVGADADKLKTAVGAYSRRRPDPVEVNPYGDGKAAAKIVDHLVNKFGQPCCAERS